MSNLTNRMKSKVRNVAKKIIRNMKPLGVNNNYTNRSFNRTYGGNYTNKSMMRMKREVRYILSKRFILGKKNVEILKDEHSQKYKIKFGKLSVETSFEIEPEKTEKGVILKAKLNNGRYAQIKVMPEQASTKALERLKLKQCTEENGCKIELKTKEEGKGVKAMYVVQTKKKAKLFGLFSTEMDVEAEVDADNGNVKVKKPWWSFLASEE